MEVNTEAGFKIVLEELESAAQGLNNWQFGLNLHLHTARVVYNANVNSMSRILIIRTILSGLSKYVVLSVHPQCSPAGTPPALLLRLLLTAEWWWTWAFGGGLRPFGNTFGCFARHPP